MVIFIDPTKKRMVSLVSYEPQRSWKAGSQTGQWKPNFDIFSHVQKVSGQKMGLSIVPFRCQSQWGSSQIDMIVVRNLGLSENSVPLNPLDYDHYPHSNGYLGVYPIFRPI